MLYLFPFSRQKEKKIFRFAFSSKRFFVWMFRKDQIHTTTRRRRRRVYTHLLKPFTSRWLNYCWCSRDFNSNWYKLVRITSHLVRVGLKHNSARKYCWFLRLLGSFTFHFHFERKSTLFNHNLIICLVSSSCITCVIY